VVDGRNKYKILLGIPYPRTELENIDMSKRKNENKSSINSAVFCGLQGSGTIYRLVVGRSEHCNDTSGLHVKRSNVFPR
jgi:hypothetical protein